MPSTRHLHRGESFQDIGIPAAGWAPFVERDGLVEVARHDAGSGPQKILQLVEGAKGRLNAIFRGIDPNSHQMDRFGTVGKNQRQEPPFGHRQWRGRDLPVSIGNDGQTLLSGIADPH